MRGARPVVYDLTYVVARLGAATPTGIERVDAAFARHFASRDVGPAAAAVHYGLFGPHSLSSASAKRILAEAARAWQPSSAHSDSDPAFAHVARWLTRGTVGELDSGIPVSRSAPSSALTATRWRWRLTNDRAFIPPGALYLNVAQYGLEYPLFLNWLARRSDVSAVLFIHDLLPLDDPEFFRAGYKALFDRRVETMMRFAQAAIVSSEVVASRLRDEMARRGRRPIPLVALPLPPPTLSSTDAAQSGHADVLERAGPYFLTVGTIEPRKNHLLLLNLWRDLARTPAEVPRLVMVGARGWDNEQVVDLLERSSLLAPHVLEVSGVSTPGLRRLIAGARAVLLPSFAEGYGLPLAEALAEGTPVVAADIPIFREVSQGKALLLDPLDGLGWRAAVVALTQSDSPQRNELATRASQYVAPTWTDYFQRIEMFLGEL